MGEPGTLVKFGELEHLQQLQFEGYMYMSPLPRFWQIEDDELRGDPADGVAQLLRGARGEARFEQLPDVVLSLNSWTLRIPPPDSDELNLYCMYALRPLHGSYPVDSANRRFGDNALIVTDPQRFIDTAHNVLEEHAIQHCAGLVEYYEET